MSRMIDLNLRPDADTLRQFGFIALFGFGLLAIMAWYEMLIFSFGLGPAREVVSLALAGVACVTALCSLVAPTANRPIYIGLSLLAYPIGIVVSFAIMALLFFAIIAPLAVAFRIVGRDPMNRQRLPADRSYWTPARPSRDNESYFRQY